MSAGGLGGNSAAYTELVWIVASAFGVAVIVLLGWIYRRARSARELEDAERVIAEAFGDDK